MRIRPLSAAIAAVAALSLAACNSDDDPRSISSVEFIGMPAPATAAQKADAYSTAKIKYNYSNGSSETIDLAYHRIFLTTDMIGGSMVGGLYDSNDRALADNDGPMAADGPDGTSLIQVPELTVPGGTGNPLALVVNFEYRELPPNDGVSKGGFWSKLPMATGLALIDQNRQNGSLSPKSYQNVSFRSVNGGWIHCGSTLSAWGTHLSSEEYEPDAKTRGGLPPATGTDDGTDINSFSKYYFGDAAKANPYHYGLLPEVSIDKSGKATVVKHYATGRYAREMVEMASDNRTGIGGDDGANTGLFMFVADAEKNLSAGTLYAAKVTQTAAADGGSFALKWIKLGRSTNAEIKALVDGGITFSDIFLVSNTDPGDASYRMVTTYNGTEWLKLKPGMEKAAAFLETRRYAAYLGATTEFSKMEYIAFNAKDRKFYVVISRVERGMADAAGDIRVARNDGGVVYELATAPAQNDTAGNAINSEYVGTTLVGIPELNGGWLGGSKDAEGNQCAQDKICGPDNLRYAGSIRTLFVGEDTGRRNNNYVWAFNIDTRKLSRIMTVPMAAEATGLTVVDDYNGFAYIMSNFQHPGDSLAAYTGADKAEVASLIDSNWGNRKKSAIGYLGTKDGALPKLR
ncbi:MAG: PhoX family protein [Vicinamibacterales bacterium]|nr:PhoX family protein [Vicinamibacterales bacterium]